MKKAQHKFYDREFVSSMVDCHMSKACEWSFLFFYTLRFIMCEVRDISLDMSDYTSVYEH